MALIGLFKEMPILEVRPRSYITVTEIGPKWNSYFYPCRHVTLKTSRVQVTVMSIQVPFFDGLQTKKNPSQWFHRCYRVTILRFVTWLIKKNHIWSLWLLWCHRDVTSNGFVVRVNGKLEHSKRVAIITITCKIVISCT